ncbi:glycoside hydrolase family 15 protein [Roseomonas sp. NAR14]|uniref:Glycoside hydrolase family 15 protein n=1 Tax=Roseomonas acroporae TaxID=2937791 RepID=A0A9X1Y8A2_9PROT|nr:glycoside hydrolase family 15 protein [Roseomonas acroporae]MCK8783932.1 glycoside hydrolase family 15 protein [Roseomonas acroporae]
MAEHSPAGAQREPRPGIPRPIEDHGAIGDLSTVALVATDGTIDFLCWPYFDSPSIFAALLDPEKGGCFELAPEIPEPRIVQMYLPATNVLMTRWLGEEWSAEVLDLMPLAEAERDEATRLIRRVRATRGAVTVRLRCAPRFDYARERVPATLEPDAAWFRPERGPALRLRATAPLGIEDGDVVACFTLQAGEQVDIVLDSGRDDPLPLPDVEGVIHRTVAFWQGWAGQSTYRGRWREVVTRSALVLKLLTSRHHGSMVAAATFGLPEAPGGERNWDYRATWVRDASFTMYALMRLGYQKEAQAFTRWVDERARRTDSGGRLRIMYPISGDGSLEEVSLDHLSGYGGARPVRIGNDAWHQTQLDIYGELLDSIYLANKYGPAIWHDEWMGVVRVVDHVCECWQEADAGIWEMRSAPREFLHSRLMCWVAVDRAVRLASKRSLAAPFERWVATRNAIHDDIWANFWNEERGHFVQSKGGTALDASLLMMPLVRFVGATDPRWLATLDAIGRELADDGLIHRYRGDDGLRGKEGAFAACSFWYVECLARAGRVKEARHIFEKVLRYGNHLQLYAEEFSMKAGYLGNYPQAFTHLALISAAYYLDRELDGRNEGGWRP